MLIRTEFGNTIGGYTHYPWSSEGGYLSDSSTRVFLFSLDLEEKYKPIRTDRLIYRKGNYGPCFGGDICIVDDCDKNRSSYAMFPSSFNKEGPIKYPQNQESYHLFSGAKDGYYFKILEWEVFRIEFL